MNNKADQIRKINEEFAKEIDTFKSDAARPSKDVIYFRDWASKEVESQVYWVPTRLLRFRKNNGRIASDVESYKKSHSDFDESDDFGQDILRSFLELKDPKKTTELIKSIQHAGQREPAIITADGFLINGNRRKMAIESLFEEKGEDRFKNMKVVILPGKNGDTRGGPPTLSEIDSIENRYQSHSEGKSEYSMFDTAISIRRKIERGFSLEDQMREESEFSGLSPKEFKKEVEKRREKYLAPLDSIDRYLMILNRESDYSSISMGSYDREGRWQAFTDYTKHVKSKLDDTNKRAQMGITKYDVGDIEDIAFKLIRQRKLGNLQKVHMVMRQFHKLIAHEESREQLMKLSKIDMELADEDRYDDDGIELDDRQQDKVWSKLNQEKIIRRLKKAIVELDNSKESETPKNLLEAALKKLNHKNLEPEALDPANIPEVLRILNTIEKRAKELNTIFYQIHKSK